MNKNRNKVAAMMMVVAITVSSVAMPVEAAVVGNEGIAIKREKENKVNDKITDVVLNKVNFPDSVFRKKLAKEFQIDDGGIITKYMIENCTALYMSVNYNAPESEKIKELTGIEKFVNLRVFNCLNNNIHKVDFSGNEQLEEINYENNNTFYMIPPKKNLKILNCPHNNLMTLDLSGCKLLEELTIDDNNIVELNLKDCGKMIVFSAIGNALTKLNLNNNNNLKKINLRFNENLSGLELGECEFLSELIIDRTKVNSVDFNKYKKLVKLDISNTEIKADKIDFSNHVLIQNLLIQGLDIREIILPENTLLQELNARNSNLEKINISNCKNLVKLDIRTRNDKINYLDLSKSSYLSEFDYGNSYGYIKLNEKSPLKNINTLWQQLIDNVEVIKNTNYIELKKLFPGIDMSKVNVLTEGVVNDGEKLVLGKEVPREIKYEYNTGGKSNTLKLPVILRLKEDRPPIDPNPPIPDPEPEKPNPDKPVNPNPDQGGSGGGTTTPDNKPDTKPEEKPNKPIELRGKIVGKNRYETAAKIADQMGSYNTVILVNSQTDRQTDRTN